MPKLLLLMPPLLDDVPEMLLLVLDGAPELTPPRGVDDVETTEENVDEDDEGYTVT